MTSLTRHNGQKTSVAAISVLASGSLALAKLVVGIAIGSLALISEALHSSIDLVATSVTWAVVRVSDQPADAEHHYGHGKFESLSALGVTALLYLLAGGILVEAWSRLREGAPPPEPRHQGDADREVPAEARAHGHHEEREEERHRRVDGGEEHESEGEDAHAGPDEHAGPEAVRHPALERPEDPALRASHGERRGEQRLAPAELLAQLDDVGAVRVEHQGADEALDAEAGGAQLRERYEFNDAAKFGIGDIPRPPHWSGFRLTPVEIELWRDAADGPFDQRFDLLLPLRAVLLEQRGRHTDRDREQRDERQQRGVGQRRRAHRTAIADEAPADEDAEPDEPQHGRRPTDPGGLDGAIIQQLPRLLSQLLDRGDGFLGHYKGGR